jgi:hypothetical protein
MALRTVLGLVRAEEIYEALLDDEAFALLPDVLARAGARVPK